MTAERDPMTLNESSVALGVEERSDEAPRAGRARPTPDPEVVAKPKRRQFTAQYRLRILEEAERCAQPRRGGSAASPRGVVQLPSDGLGARRGARVRFGSWPRRSAAQSPANATRWMRRCARSRRKWPRLEHELHTAHTILDVQGKVAGLLGLNLEHGARC